MNKKCYLFCRVASPTEDWELALNCQEQELREMAAKMGLEVASVSYVVSPSGSEPHRHAVLSMLQSVNRQHIGTVLVTKYSRLCRSPYEFAELAKLLNGMGSKIVSGLEGVYCETPRIYAYIRVATTQQLEGGDVRGD
jgi:DNA invertase Pin-like site-specific DNA recombinase